MSFSPKGFATIRLIVNDVAKSRDWYRVFFGAEPVEDVPHFASFLINGVHFNLVLADEKNPFSTGGSIGYWLVEDFDGALKRALELGASIYRGPLKVPEIRRTIAQIRDPFGNVIGLEG